jgi:cytochrome c
MQTEIPAKWVGWSVAATLTGLVAAAAVSRADSPPAGDAAHGKSIYEICQGCHSLDENDVGPKHRGVVGRTAGSIADYAYSPALKQSGVVWNAATLDRWLTNPQGVVPGTKMFFALSNPQDRADVIAYLAQQK